MKKRRFLKTVPVMVTMAMLIVFIGGTGANAANGKPVALIIGNGDYALNPIASATNDAQEITTTLKDLGYELFIRKNLDRERLLNTVSAFEKALSGAELGLFFYVGHGVQYKGKNYLVPLGAYVESDWQIPEACVALDDIVAKVARSGVKTALFLIDAARPGPLGTRFSPPESGLADIKAPANSHIILADAPHHLARQGVDPLPGADRTSLFASTFLALLKEVPDLPIGRFMRQLQLAVAVKSGQDRNPWYRLGRDDSIKLYNSRGLFANKLKSWPASSSLDQTRAFMADALGVPATRMADDPKTDPKNPWAQNPILVVHTLLRDLEKLSDVKRAKFPANIYQAGMSALKAKHGYLKEGDEATWTLDQLLISALTREWPWPDPFLSPELAAKTAAAEAAKKAKLLLAEAEAEGQDSGDNVSADQDGPSTQPETPPEGEADSSEPLDTVPEEKTNPAIAPFKARLILSKYREMVTASRLPEPLKRMALEAMDDHARELEVNTDSIASLFDRAMTFDRHETRKALIISDGEMDQAVAKLTQTLKMSGFTVTLTTPDLWADALASQNALLTATDERVSQNKTLATADELSSQNETVAASDEPAPQNETFTINDVSLFYVTSDRVPLKDLVDALTASTNTPDGDALTPSPHTLNIVIMDPVFSTDAPEQLIEPVDAPPENMVILLADTPTALKEDVDTPKEAPSEDAPPFVRPEGPVLAKALAEHLDAPGQTLTALFQKVQKEVATASEEHLKPWWIYGSALINTPFQFNDSGQKFTHLLAQLDLFRYLEATKAEAELFDIGWDALVRDHPDWTWFVEKGSLSTVLDRAFATDRADTRHTIALKRGLRPRFTNEQGMTFIYQPGGIFLMGSFPDEAGRSQDETIAETTISNGYYLMQTEVTQAHWKTVMGKNVASFSDCGPHCPIETVSWQDAQAFIKRLNGVESFQVAVLPSAFQKRYMEQLDQGRWHTFTSELERYLKNVGSGYFSYRLPTEAQWEFACRSGRKTWFGFGSELWRLPEYAWYNENAPHSTQAVATKRSHENGFYDLHGNVWEWCQNGQGGFKAVRGGSWYYDALSARCAKRFYLKPNDANYNVGLRLVAVPATY